MFQGREPEITSVDGAPTYTSYCLDYMWASQHFDVCGVLNTPHTLIMANPQYFPETELFPSDHILMMAKFKLK